MLYLGIEIIEFFEEVLLLDPSGQDNLFKSSTFGGFKREDVLDYIEKMDTKHTTEMAELRKKVEEINAERNHYANQLQTCDAEMMRLQGQIQTMIEQLHTQNDVIASQNDEINMYRTMISEKEEDLSLQSDSIKKLSYQNEALLYKSQQFDKMMDESNDAYYEIQRHADYYLQDLSDQNRSISHQTKQNAKQLEQRVAATLSSMDDIHTGMHDLYKDFLSHFATIEASVKDISNLMPYDPETGETEYTTYLKEKQEKMQTVVETFLTSEKETLSPPKIKNFGYASQQVEESFSEDILGISPEDSNAPTSLPNKEEPSEATPSFTIPTIESVRKASSSKDENTSHMSPTILSPEKVEGPSTKKEEDLSFKENRIQIPKDPFTLPPDTDFFGE